MKYIAGGVHSNYRYKESGPPLYFSRSEGSRIWDVDGNEYLDLYAKSGAMFLGHANSIFLNALSDNTGPFNVDQIPYSINAAEAVVRHFPGSQKIRFGLSGNESIQNALRIARAYTGKNKFIRFIGHFHGTADNMLGGVIASDGYIPMDDEENDIFYTKGRAKGILSNQSFLLPWNDFDKLKAVIDLYGNEIAAVIMEPVNLNGGSIIPRPGYLQRVKDLCASHRILLIFDEVVTGIRMGLGGAQTIYNVTPDITILGKCLGGGSLPVSAIMGSSKIMELYSKYAVVHGGTFNGYPMGMLAVNAVYQILEAEEHDLYGKTFENSRKLQEIFLDASKRAGLPLVIQGPLTCSSYHVCDKELKEFSELNETIKIRNAVLKNCLQKYGILTAHTSRIYTNIALHDSDIEFFEQRVYPAILDAQFILNTIDK